MPHEPVKVGNFSGSAGKRARGAINRQLVEHLRDWSKATVENIAAAA